MGIQSLLTQLIPASRVSSVQAEVTRVRYGNKPVIIAVDVLSWLYNAGKTIALDIMTQPESIVAHTLAHMLSPRCKMLQLQGGTPVLIFDGIRPPLKQAYARVTAFQRQELHDNARQRIQRILDSSDTAAVDITTDTTADGPSERNHAAQQAAADTLQISSTLCDRVAGILSQEGWRCIRAPSEADGQLVALVQDGVAQLIATEDSDILCFALAAGIRQASILYKMDSSTQHVRVIDITPESPQNWALADRTAPKSARIVSNALRTCSPREFVLACILAGCDYAKSPCGVGFVQAMRIVQAVPSRLSTPQFLRRAVVSLLLPRLSQRKHRTPLPYGSAAAYLVRTLAAAAGIYHHVVCSVQPHTLRLQAARYLTPWPAGTGARLCLPCEETSAAAASSGSSGPVIAYTLEAVCAALPWLDIFDGSSVDAVSVVGDVDQLGTACKNFDEMWTRAPQTVAAAAAAQDEVVVVVEPDRPYLATASASLSASSTNVPRPGAKRKRTGRQAGGQACAR